MAKKSQSHAPTPTSSEGLGRIARLVRVVCPSLERLEQLTIAAFHPGQAKEEDQDAQRSVSLHIASCEACREDYGMLMANARIRYGSPQVVRPQPREVVRPLEALVREIYELTKQQWGQRSPRISDTIADCVALLKGAVLSKSDKRLPSVDRWISRELSRLGYGDQYQAITRIGNFWTQGVCQGSNSMLNTETFRATIAALMMGATVQRLFPIHIAKHKSFMQDMSRAHKEGRDDNSSWIPDDMRYIREHLDLQRDHPGCSVKFVIVRGKGHEALLPIPSQLARMPDSMHDAPIQHCGLCLSRSEGGSVAAFVPTYDKRGHMHGMALLDDQEAIGCATDFESVWKGAFTMEELLAHSCRIMEEAVKC